jgi:hypothetical protein
MKLNAPSPVRPRRTARLIARLLLLALVTATSLALWPAERGAASTAKNGANARPANQSPRTVKATHKTKATTKHKTKTRTRRKRTAKRKVKVRPAPKLTIARVPTKASITTHGTTTTSTTSSAAPSHTTSTAPSTTTTASLPTPPAVPTPNPRLAVITPEQFGAVGDGVTDDTAALQRAFDAAQAGQVVHLAGGKTYRHTQVLILRNAGEFVSGPGTLLATDEQNSAVYVGGDNITLEGGLTLKMGATTQRWDAYQQMKLLIGPYSGDVVSDVTVNGAAAAGIMIDGASHYLIANDTVENTNADGIHNTGGSHDGFIINATVRNTGDDGIAVVSYHTDSTPCHDIYIESPRFYGNTWGRGFTVVGGDNITWTNIFEENSNAAGVYIAAEGAPYYTYGSHHIKVLGGTLVNSNTNPTINHGAVLIYNGQPSYTIADVDLENLTITNTRSTASGQVGVLGRGSGGITGVQLQNFTITGGPSQIFGTDEPASSYDISGWTFNGVAEPSHGRLLTRRLGPRPAA